MSLPLELGSFHRDKALDSLERQLICPICLEVFTKPVVILPCQHNLCRKCANDLFQARGNVVGAGGRFRCPSCRHEVILDRHGVYGLQRNLLVENIIDIYKQESVSSGPLPKPTGHPSCEEHEDEKVNIYCLSCQVPTCSLCKVFGAHKGCQVAPLPEVYQQQKAELSDGISSLAAANDHVQAFIGELEETCRNIEENCKSQKQMLCEKFERMYNILEERRKVMTQHITYEQEEKTGHTRSLVQAYGEQVEANSKLVETALHTMEEPEMAAFLQSARMLIEKITGATRTSVVEALEPGFDNMNHYKVDFNAEERALYQLDFVKTEEDVEEVEEPEVEVEPEREPVLEPEPKEESSEAKGPEGDAGDIGGQAEGCADPKKEHRHDHGGLSTQQDEPELGQKEHDAGDLEIQGLQAEASEDARLYPSWYKSSSWQVVGPSLAVPSDPLEGSDRVAPEPQPLWMGDSLSPVGPEEPSGPLIRGNLGNTQGFLSLAVEEGSGLGQSSVSLASGTTTLPQAVTFAFYFLALVVILQRVWDHIKCITCI